MFLGIQERSYCPVFFGFEFFDSPLALDNEPYRNGLNAPGGKPAVDFFPQKRGELVAHESVEDSARLLGIDAFHIKVARMCKGFLNRALCDFVKYDSFDVVSQPIFKSQCRYEVPRDRLSLAVFVSREN